MSKNMSKNMSKKLSYKSDKEVLDKVLELVGSLEGWRVSQALSVLDDTKKWLTAAIVVPATAAVELREEFCPDDLKGKGSI